MACELRHVAGAKRSIAECGKSVRNHRDEAESTYKKRTCHAKCETCIIARLQSEARDFTVCRAITKARPPFFGRRTTPA